MTLAERRRQGAALPYSLPSELLSVAMEDLPSSSPAATLPSAVLAPVVAQDSGPSNELWEPSAEELGEYKQIFLSLVGDSDGLLDAQEAKKVLERSGVPLTELAAIWYLADVDGDGQLALCEFACAMHLTVRRRAGAPLPEELPSPLTRLVAGAIDFPDVPQWGPCRIRRGSGQLTRMCFRKGVRLAEVDKVKLTPRLYAAAGGISLMDEGSGHAKVKLNVVETNDPC
ncbi:REPS1 [Symbiodinium pilosum]|uniref:REPS1 protein n=1 Tax=Symbiodinium pilosum TaxID=2952 RepID=A0A812J5A3_SYMPI|nr:REPS1 [Symbiodinium pilosum]